MMSCESGSRAAGKKVMALIKDLLEQSSPEEKNRPPAAGWKDAQERIAARAMPSMRNKAIGRASSAKTGWMRSGRF